MLSLDNNSPVTCEGGAAVDHGGQGALLGVGGVNAPCDPGFDFLLVPRARLCSSERRVFGSLRTAFTLQSLDGKLLFSGRNF